MAGMPAHPFPVDDVAARGSVEPLPQIDVLYRLLVGGAPTAPLPAVDPLGDAVAQILAVAIKADAARSRKRFQPGDRSHQFHSVVGGIWVVAAKFLLDAA